MKTRILELLLAVVLFVLPQTGITYSYFTDEATVGQNVMTAGCWVKPEAPRLAYPENNSVANLGSDWLANPYMDWGDSVTTCPTGSITYIYESYHDSDLTSLAYRSPPLINSVIPAPGTPDGTYYWRVKAFDGSTYSDWSEVWLLTIDRTPPVPPPSSPTVVINEVMWMGSTVHRLDEWVELRNTTSSDINITGWKLYGAGPGPNEIVLVGTIKANDYFLLSHYASDNIKSAIKDYIIADQVDSSVHLTNRPGEQLTLKDTSDNIIDQTPTGSWAAGTHTSPATVEQSMERNNDPTTGWHTCIDVACIDTTYWDAEGNNYGTPRAANLSENDSSLNLQEEGQDQDAEQAFQDEEIVEEEVEEVVEEDVLENEENKVEEDSSLPADPGSEDGSQVSVLPDGPEVEQEAPNLPEDLGPPLPEIPAQPASPEEIINE